MKATRLDPMILFVEDPATPTTTSGTDDSESRFGCSCSVIRNWKIEPNEKNLSTILPSFFELNLAFVS
jgi:hypothetical protein